MPGDRWGIEGKAGVIDDFSQALGQRYQWTAAEDPLAALTRRVTELEQAAAALRSGIANATKAAADVLALRRDAEGLAAQVTAARPSDLRARLNSLSTQIKALEDSLNGPSPVPGGLPIVDKTGVLAHGPTPYPVRNLAAIRRIVVHHTVTPGDFPPERLAQLMVQRGLPGITYHYLVSANGTVYATQPLEAQVSQTGKADVNADGIAVALAGDFTNTVPPDPQMASTALLIADLLDRFHLPVSAVLGAREVSQTASPGNQWLSGAKYKDALIARINALLVVPKGDDTDVLLLQKQVEELQGRVANLNAQVAALTQHVAELEATVASQAAEIARLQARLAGQLGGRVAKPALVDKVSTLARHPTLPPYSRRTRPISMIVVHHTDTPKTMSVEQIAQYHVFGERKDAQGNVIKAPWPGIGYHFLIGPDGVITQGQAESTRSYHVGGDPNDYSVAISLIGRFMRKNYDGTDRAPEDQEPTPQQLEERRRVGRLAHAGVQDPAGTGQGPPGRLAHCDRVPGRALEGRAELVPEVGSGNPGRAGGGGWTGEQNHSALPALLGPRHGLGRGGLAAARRGTSPASGPPRASRSTTRSWPGV